MKNIFVSVLLIFSGMLFALDKESYNALLSIDSAPIKPVDLCISFFTKNIKDVPLNADGMSIVGREYECYNNVLEAIRTNSVSKVKPYLYEFSNDKKKRLTAQINLLNKYWVNISSKTSPRLVKIVNFGDNNVFFLRVPNKNNSGYLVLYIHTRKISGSDFWIWSGAETNQPALSLITYLLMEKDISQVKSDNYKNSLPLTGGENGIILYFNGKKVFVNLDEKNNDSPLLSFCHNAFVGIKENFDSYPSFFSQFVSQKIAEDIKKNKLTQQYLQNEWNKANRLIYIIDASPMYIILYEYPGINSITPRFVYNNGQRYYFVNSFDINPLSEILMNNRKAIIDPSH